MQKDKEDIKMMGKNKNTAAVAETQARIGTVIGPGAVFDGNLKAPEAVRVDGVVNGNCDCAKNMVIGQDGRIEGNITAQNIVISGKVNGDIMISGKLELYSTGRVTGNITARSLVIDEDAYFDGRCTMTTAKNEMPVTEKKEEAPAKKSLASKLGESPEEDEAL